MSSSDPPVVNNTNPNNNVAQINSNQLISNKTDRTDNSTSGVDNQIPSMSASGDTVQNRSIAGETDNDETLRLRQGRVADSDSTQPGSLPAGGVPDGLRQRDGPRLQSPPVEDLQPLQRTPPVPPRRPRPFVDDNSIITRNQLAFFLTVAFGIIVAFGLAHIYKQVQTAYIVSSLLHNVPVSKTPYRKPSNPNPSQPKPSAPNIGSDVSDSSPTSTTIIKPELSPEIEVYAQQLQKVLGSLKRALRNVDKSDNSSQIAGIIEMKPHSEEHQNEESFPGEKNVVSEVDDENATPVGSAKGDIKNDLNEDDMKGQSQPINMKESQLLGKKQQEILTQAYKLAADYVTNLHTIVDEEMRRNAEENPDAQEQFDLEQKKEENLKVFRKFVEMVGEAQTLDDDDDSYPVPDTTAGIGDDFMSDFDSDTWAEISKSEDLSDGKANDLYNAISETLDDLAWNENENENGEQEDEFEEKMDKARMILADINEQREAEIESQKLYRAKASEPQSVTEIPENKEKERKSKEKEDSSPLFS